MWTEIHSPLALALGVLHLLVAAYAIGYNLYALLMELLQRAQHSYILLVAPLFSLIGSGLIYQGTGQFYWWLLPLALVLDPAALPLLVKIFMDKKRAERPPPGP